MFAVLGSVRALLHRCATGAAFGALCTIAALGTIAGCTELPPLEQERTPRGSLGDEVFKLACRRLAGTEMPGDLDGSESAAVCLGEASEVTKALDAGAGALPARLRALVERRERIVAAVDTALPVQENEDGEEEKLGNELEEFLRELVGFYEPPEERVQRAARSVATAAETLLFGQDGQGGENWPALRGLARFAHSGTVGREQALGMYEALLGSPELESLLHDALPVFSQDAAMNAALRVVLAGLALELADLEEDEDPESAPRLTRDLMLRTHPDFASGEPVWVAGRDERGLPRVQLDEDGEVPSPFVDADDDGLADESDGVLVLEPGGQYVSPLPRFDEAEVARDAQGRALASDGSGHLYAYVNADDTFLRGVLTEARGLFDPDTRLAVNMARAAPVLFGDPVDSKHRVGAAVLEGYSAPDTDASPIIDLVHASNVLTHRDVFDRTLDMTTRLVRDHEAELAALLESLIELERAVRPDDPRYPEGKMVETSTFWYDLFYELAKVSRRREHPDETLLETLLRAAGGRMVGEPGRDPRQRFQGALVSVMLRYRDPWRSDPRDPEAPALGGFRQLVDRDQPDAPVTCGKDGCGGRMADSLHFDFDGYVTSRNQKCVIQRPGQIGEDCGAPANQSLMHRSANLILEMRDRGVCNRGIAVEDMLSFAVPACRGEADRLPPFGEPDGDLYDPPGGDDPCDVLDLDPGSEECRQMRSLERQQCQALEEQREAEREDLVINSKKALEAPAAVARYVLPFESGPDPVVAHPDGQLFPVQECELFGFDEVGRVFGQALTNDFVLRIPHPGLKLYLEDVARAGRPDVAVCEDLPIDWTDPPADPPDCVPEAAETSRSVFQDIDPEVDTLDELIEYLSKVKGMTTQPNASALTRVLFAAPGTTGLQVFDPLLVHGAPPFCVQDDGSDLRDEGAPACSMDDSLPEEPGCCIADPLTPPLRYRVDTYYGDTAFAWDVPFEVRDPKTGEVYSVTFNETLVPFAAAVNAHDFDPVQDADRAEEFEDTGYLLATLGGALAKHYDSAENPLAQNTDPDAPHYRTLSGLVRLEPLLADALDDGSIVSARLDVLGDVEDDPGTLENERFIEGPLPDLPPARQLGLLSRAYDLFNVLDAMDFGEAGDGVDVSADLSEHLFNPHAGCATSPEDRGVVAGEGACHRTKASGEGPRQPVAYRNGQDYVCYHGQACLDDEENYRFVSPARLFIDALYALEDRIEEDEEVNQAFQAVRNGITDDYLAIEDGQLADRTLRALLLHTVEFLRERWAYHAAEGDLREWADELTSDVVEAVENPVIAGSLQLLEEALEHPEVVDAVNAYAHSVLGGDVADRGFQALAAAVLDTVQQLPGDGNHVAFTRALSEAFAPGVSHVVENGGNIDVREGAIYRNLMLTADSLELDEERVLARVMRNLVRPTEVAGEPAMPLELILDALVEVNRAEPGAGTPVDAEGWRSVLGHLVDLLRDERRGVERLFQLVRCREAPEDDPDCR